MARRVVRVYPFSRNELSNQLFHYARQLPKSQNYHQKDYADVNHMLIASESDKLRIASPSIFLMLSDLLIGFKNIKSLGEKIGLNIGYTWSVPTF